MKFFVCALVVLLSCNLIASHTIKKNVKVVVPIHQEKAVKVVKLDPVKMVKAGSAVAGAVMSGAKIAVKAKKILESHPMMVEEHVSYQKSSKLPKVVVGAIAGSMVGGAKAFMKMKPKYQHVEVSETLSLPQHVQESLIIQPKTTFTVQQIHTRPASTKMVKAQKMEQGHSISFAKKKILSAVTSPLHLMSKLKSHLFG